VSTERLEIRRRRIAGVAGQDSQDGRTVREIVTDQVHDRDGQAVRRRRQIGALGTIWIRPNSVTAASGGSSISRFPAIRCCASSSSATASSPASSSGIIAADPSTAPTRGAA
jgi:hypothetical protein